MRTGQWSAQGKLEWPWGGEYDQPQPIRVCYPNVMLRNRAVHFCGVSDIVEPYARWRAYKKELTGREWDYDFRRLFYTWTDDITSKKFERWVEIASRDKTCGWIGPCDLYVADDGRVHVLWTERAIDPRLRTTFFPDARQSHALNYAVIVRGQVVRQQTLVLAEEGGANEIVGAARFHVAPRGTPVRGLSCQRHGPTRPVDFREPYPRTELQRDRRHAGARAPPIADGGLLHRHDPRRIAPVPSPGSAGHSCRPGQRDLLCPHSIVVTIGQERISRITFPWTSVRRRSSPL